MTENLIKLIIENGVGSTDGFFVRTEGFLRLNQVKQVRQQILTALQEYPKLKEQLETQEQNVVTALANWKDQQLQNQKLKAENEDLKAKIAAIERWES